MYAFIEGKVAGKKPGEVILLAGGVGYRILVSLNTLSHGDQGDVLRLYTWLSVRDDAMELFGFATEDEKRLFERLISVSGIGPKTALGVLSSMPFKDLTLAIVMGDTNALSRAPGIGKKTASRIALELKDKLTEADFSADLSDISMVTGANDNVSEALAALQSLGYTPSEAKSAIAKVKDEATETDALIKLALRAMSGF